MKSTPARTRTESTLVTTTAPLPSTTPARGIRYEGLVVLMLMGFLLVTAEFLPNGVL